MRNDRFKQDADLLLGGLQWTQADGARVLSELKGEKIPMKRKMRLGLVLALAITLLAAVGLAVGLTYSPSHAILQTARRAVMEKYALTNDMLRLYLEQQPQEQDGVTTVRYLGSDTDFLQSAPMGEYMAVIGKDGSAVASWTYDGVSPDTWQGGDLSSPVWGAKQLQMVIDRYASYEQWQKETPDLYQMSINEQGKRLRELDEKTAPLTVGLVRTDLPEKSDLPEETALALAKKALEEHYGVTLSQAWITERLFKAGGEDGRRYVFYFHQNADAANGSSPRHHAISVASPSGEITMDYSELKDADEPEETVSADAKQRALDLSKQALAEKYELTDDMLTLFFAKVSQDASNPARVTVTYLPVDMERFYEKDSQWNANLDWRWISDLTDKLGSYTVSLDLPIGKAPDAGWTLDDKRGDATESSWATAEAYDARILTWALDLMARNKPIIDQYPDDQTEWFTVEDAAAYDQAFRDAGFDAKRYNHALPKASDLSREEAERLAREAMTSEYGLSKTALEDARLTVCYVLDGGGAWDVGFYTAQGMGSVTIDAATGEIRRVYLDAPETGNG